MVYEAIIAGAQSYFACEESSVLPILRIIRANRRTISPSRLRIRGKYKELGMIKKKILNPRRIRGIDGGFSYIPHRFLTDGFLASLHQKELLVYLFLILASDRYGLSFYSYDSICSLLQLTFDQYIEARDGLMEKDLIAFDGTVFQVLDLPPTPTSTPVPESNSCCNHGEGPVSIAQVIKKAFNGV